MQITIILLLVIITSYVILICSKGLGKEEKLIATIFLALTIVASVIIYDGYKDIQKIKAIQTIKEE